MRWNLKPCNIVYWICCDCFERLVAKSKRPFKSVHIWNINGNQWPACFLVCFLLERCHWNWTQWLLDELCLNSLAHGEPLLAALFKVWPKPGLRAGEGSVTRSSPSGPRRGYGRGWTQNCPIIARRFFFASCLMSSRYDSAMGWTDVPSVFHHHSLRMTRSV